MADRAAGPVWVAEHAEELTVDPVRAALRGEVTS
jgi:hypothetical protein